MDINTGSKRANKIDHMYIEVVDLILKRRGKRQVNTRYYNESKIMIVNIGNFYDCNEN